MKNTALFTSATALVLMAGAAYGNGFTGPYAPGTWTISPSIGGSSAVFSADSRRLTITGPNAGFVGNQDVTHTVVASGLWCFNWDYTSVNSPGFDSAYYLFNGVPSFLSDTSGTSGTACIIVSAGDTIGYRVNSADGLFGPGVLNIDRFEIPTPAPPCDNGVPPEVIKLRSGQVNCPPVGLQCQPGPPCIADSVITYAPFGNPTVCTSPASTASLFPLNFPGAESGPPAEIIAPFPWPLTSLPCDPDARWISWSTDPSASCVGFPGHSVLYAHPFSVTSTCIGQAMLEFCFGVDDALGDPGGPAPEGVYIGQPGSVPVALPVSGGSLFTPTTITAPIPAGALMPGNNVLYVYQRNTTCDLSGVIYSATISVSPCTCLNVSNEKILCPLEDTTSPCYTYSFEITNKSGLTAKYLTLPAHPIGMPAVTIQPSDINFLTQYGSLLEDGESASIELTICGGDPGDQVSFVASLLTEDFQECCFQELCIELPQCDCGQLSCQLIFTFGPFPDPPVNFNFTLDNLSPFPVDEVHFIPSNFEQGDFVKDVFDLSTPLPPGASLPMSVQIIGAPPGEEFCFFVLLLHPGEKSGKDCCCAFEKCITMPEFSGPGAIGFPGACCLPPPQGGCIQSTIGACQTLGGSFGGILTSCFCTECPQLLLCPVDLNRDDQIDGLDLAVLLGQWTGASVYQPCPPNAPADCNQDCHINGLDLSMMLGTWGPCK